MRLQVSSYLSIRLSVLKEKRDSHQKDFRGISYLGLLLKIVDTFPIFLSRVKIKYVFIYVTVLNYEARLFSVRHQRSRGKKSKD